MNGWLWFLQLWSAETASSEASAAQAGGTSPLFIGIVVLVAIGMLVMIIQNFVLKKEEYYK